MVKKIISGGQTGVDRAALDSAMNLNFTIGGWCPKGRIDELGIIPSKYHCLKEINVNIDNESDNYNARTRLNIADSDGTLIIVPVLPLPSQIKDGTLLTIKEVSLQRKPYIIISLSPQNDESFVLCLEWVKEHDIRILNIAGPRESNSVGIYENSYNYLNILLPMLISTNTYIMK